MTPARRQRGSAFWDDLASDLCDPEFCEAFDEAAAVTATLDGIANA